MVLLITFRTVIRNFIYNNVVEKKIEIIKLNNI